MVEIYFYFIFVNKIIARYILHKYYNNIMTTCSKSLIQPNKKLYNCYFFVNVCLVFISI